MKIKHNRKIFRTKISFGSSMATPCIKMAKVFCLMLKEFVKSKCLSKRYYKIDEHLARHFKYNGACLSTPLSLSMQPNNFPFF